MIANPQNTKEVRTFFNDGLQIPRTQKRLGHFLTTDCKSVETPNGIDVKSFR